VIVGIVAALTAWKTVQIALNIAMMANPVGLLVVAIAALVVGVIYAYRRFEGFRNAVNGAWGVLKSVFGWIGRNWKLLVSIIGGPLAAVVVLVASNFGRIKSAATSVVGFVRDKFNAFVSFIKGIPGRIADVGRGLFNGFLEAARTAFNGIASIWNSSVGKLNFKIPDWVPGIGGKTFGVPTIPALAAGGVITSPGMALVGERGPELVTLDAGAQVHPAGSAMTKAATARPARSQGAARQAPAGGSVRDRMMQPIQLVLPNGRVLTELVAETFEDDGLAIA
jgi:phage-related protein